MSFTIEEMQEACENVRDLYDKIAHDAWPHGAVLLCQCGWRERVSAEDCARFLRKGWPTCHGKTMTIAARRRARREAKP